MSEKWKPGDLVRHKSGGPKMVVDCYDQAGLVACSWFENNNAKQVSFPETSLEAWQQPPPSLPTVINPTVPKRW